MEQFQTGGIEAAVIRNIRISSHDLRISLVGLSNKPGVAAAIFDELGKGGINVNLIVQNMKKQDDDSADISFTILPEDEGKVKTQLEAAKGKKLIEDYFVHGDQKIFVIEGDGMQTHTDIAARIFKRLGDARINIEMICTSELEISCAVSADNVQASLEMLHQEFKEEIKAN